MPPRRSLHRRTVEEIPTPAASPDLYARKDEGAFGNPERMIHELQVHRIELEMQNDELRRTQQELDKSRIRYLDLYDFSPVSYLTAGPDGMILEANLTSSVLLGVERISLLQRPFPEFILAADRDLYDRHRDGVLAGGDVRSDDMRMLRGDGTPFWANIRSVAVEADDGSPLHHVVVTDISERKRSEEALKSSLAEKDLLMRELAHRTKNNMQVISNLIGLQVGILAEKRFTDAFEETQDRIRAMALVHENLSRTGTFSSPDMREYVTELFTSLLRIHQGSCGLVTPELDVEKFSVSIDTAVSLGLIINELISNSLKHAFPPGKAGTISLSFRRVGEGTELRYRDDGPGLPRDIDLTRIPSLGLKLVNNLAVRQLRGRLDLRHDPATEFVFTFGNFELLEK